MAGFRLMLVLTAELAGTRTIGARHLVQTNRLQNLRRDVEILLWKASNDQYQQRIASQTDPLPYAYDENKEIARYVRVRHAPILPFQTCYVIVTSLGGMC